MAKLKKRLTGGGGYGGMQIQPSVSPWASFADSFMKGFLGTQQLSKQREEMDLRKKLVDLQTKKAKAELEEQEVRNKLGAEIEAPQEQTAALPGVAPEQTEPGPMGFTGLSPELAMPGMETTTTQKPGLRQRLLAQAVREGKIGEALKPEPFDPTKFMSGEGGSPTFSGLPLSGVNVGASGPSYRFGEGRQALSADNQLWAKLLQKHGGNFEAAREDYNKEIQKTFGARYEGPFDVKAKPGVQETQKAFQRQGAQGSALGTLDVQSSPGYQQTQTDIEAARQAGKPLPESTAGKLGELDTILDKGAVNQQLFKPEYTGVIPKGVGGTGAGGLTGAYRQRMGSIAPEETTFRQNTADIQDALLRARSGAQINEQEYKRLSKIAPNINDQPEVYKQKLVNFLDQVRKLRENKLRLTTTPRGQLGPAPTIPVTPQGDRWERIQ